MSTVYSCSNTYTCTNIVLAPASTAPLKSAHWGAIVSVYIINKFTPVWMTSYSHYTAVPIPALVPALYLRLYLYHLCKVYIRWIYVCVYHWWICTSLGEFISTCVAVPIPVLVSASLVIMPSPVISLQGPYQVQLCLYISSIGLHLSW